MFRDETNQGGVNSVPNHPTAAAPAEMKAGVDGSARTLDVFKFFEKPAAGDALAIFSLTRTNEERRRRSSRLI